MKFCTAAIDMDETSVGLAVLAETVMSKLDEEPDFLLIAYSEHHDPAVLHQFLSVRFPNAALLGSTTCRGVVTDRGLAGFGNPVIALAAIKDPGADFGTASISSEQDLASAIEAAQAAAGRAGEVPELVWLHASPGIEEQMIAGVQSVLGATVLISGGSSADESIAGNWSQFVTTGPAGGAALALIYTDMPVTHHFQSGYLPTNKTGMATRAEARVLYEIDNRPAAFVYNDWSGGRISAALEDQRRNILGDTAWSPLGKSIGRIGPSPELMVDCYCLVHPDSVGPEGELRLFADIDEGSSVVLMRSGEDELIKRAVQVVRGSLDMAPTDHLQAGGLMVFCAGCMLALGDRIGEAADRIREAFGDIPFLGVFTFGEQGSFLNGDRLHGNLMISSTLFNSEAGASLDGN